MRSDKNISKKVFQVQNLTMPVYFILDILFCETLFRINAFGGPSWTVYLVLFSVSFGLFAAAIVSLFGGKGRRIAAGIVSFLILCYYFVNLLYQHIFKSFLSLSQIGMGTDAITTYIKEILISLGQCWLYMLCLILPLVLLIVYCKKGGKTPGARNLILTLILLVCALLFHGAGYFAVAASGDNAYGPKDVYSDTFVLPMSHKYFGSLTSTRLEIKGLLFYKGGNVIIADDPIDEPEEPEEPEIVYPYNVMDIDFAALAENTSDERIKTLHNYFASRTGTKQNEMTGKFAGYNIIELCCESFSPYLIDEERTPMLYRMATEGYNFTNYYSCINDNTSNSEYTLITGLLPDMTLLGKGWNNFYNYNSSTTSKNNYLPFCLGNQLKAHDIKSWGFHYYYGTYYGRKESHPNFGYDFYYMTHGMTSTQDWPTSDLEMAKQSLAKVLKPDEDGNIAQFGAYYLTFSGHMHYNFNSNRIARINKSVSDNLNISASAKAYVSCNQELEKALEYMVEELEKAGVLDKTLIVLTQDHYPYALGLGPLSEVAGKNLQEDAFETEFNQYKGTLLMWSPSMEEGRQIDTVCCELDILPTLTNLLGFEYDSRLLMGNDIFADCDHIAVLSDRSFITDTFRYYAADGSIRYFDEDAEEVSPSALNSLLNSIKNKFTVSSEILYTDYYSFLK